MYEKEYQKTHAEMGFVQSQNSMEFLQFISIADNPQKSIRTALSLFL